MQEVKRSMLQIEGGKIPVTLSVEDELYFIHVDGVQWVETDSRTHAAVLYAMMRDHITEYMHYTFSN